MDKTIVVFLSDHGWPQAKIARLFAVSPARICQIVAYLGGDTAKARCEVCKKLIKKKNDIHKVKVKLKSLLLCNDCNEELLESY